MFKKCLVKIITVPVVYSQLGSAVALLKRPELFSVYIDICLWKEIVLMVHQFFFEKNELSYYYMGDIFYIKALIKSDLLQIK